MDATSPSHTLRRISHPRFHLARPTFLPSELAPSAIPTNPQSRVTWIPHPEASDLTPRHFPILLEPDGSPWLHGNLYLLDRVLRRAEVNDETLDQIARDIKSFRELLNIKNIDYLSDHQIKILRPTYAAKAELAERCKNGKLSRKSANRILSRVVDLYEFLKEKINIKFRYTLYTINYKQQPFQNHIGQVRHKTIRTSDLTLKAIKNPHQYDHCIYDGEKLRPLLPGEIEQLIKALSKIGNTTMTLAFLIALTTGARIQTVFTLRLSCLREEYCGDEESIPIAVGAGTKTNTKFSKRLTLHLPGWLHNRLKTYSNAETSTQRRLQSNNEYANTDEQYLFLTRNGSPYYISKEDPTRRNYGTPPSGGSVRKFIYQQLLPELQSLGFSSTFKFHDLRATFGMSIVRTWITKIEAGEATMDELLAHVMMRMGHNDVATTLRYLSYDFNENAILKAQMNWEQLTTKLIEKGYDLFANDEGKKNEP